LTKFVFYEFDDIVLVPIPLSPPPPPITYATTVWQIEDREWGWSIYSAATIFSLNVILSNRV